MFEPHRNNLPRHRWLALSVTLALTVSGPALAQDDTAAAPVEERLVGSTDASAGAPTEVGLEAAGAGAAPMELGDAETAGSPDDAQGDAQEPADAAVEAPPVAENVDLSMPVEDDALDDAATAESEPTLLAPPDIPLTYSNEQPSLFILGTEVLPSTSARLAWTPEQSFDGISVPTPVLVVNGAKRGPVLCLTAAVHGDELNGIEIVRRVMYDLDPDKLSGAVIGVPIVNLQGFRRASRYLPDRRDLNRFFPGNPKGSLASRIAHSFFTNVIDHCEALVDLHTGSFKRTNLPQLRADLRNPDVVHLTRGFGSTVVLHSSGSEGTLRRAATDRGIPTVTLEAGEPARLQEKEVEHGTKGVMTLMNELDMYRKVTFWGSREPVYYRSTWVRADRGGVLFSEVELGERVARGQVLGTITDPITNVQSTLTASTPGRVLGMALNQFVMPGFAAFRIGIETPDRNRMSDRMDDRIHNRNGAADGLQETVTPTAADGSTHTAASESAQSSGDNSRLLDGDSSIESEADEADGAGAQDDELENSE